jgi:hypothetical protein
VLKAIVRFGLLDGLLMLVVFPIIVSIDGYKKEKSWMVWSGGVLFAFYLFIVRLDLYKGYLGTSLRDR